MDFLHHRLLLTKLRAMRFSLRLLTWFEFYLSNWSQCVQSDESESEWESVACGVPQGYILGPLLFTQYVNYINSQIMCSKFQIYDDNLQIYTRCKHQDVGRVVNDLNTDIDRLLLWTEKHGLKLNPDKTKPIIIAYAYPCLRNHIQVQNVPSIVTKGSVMPYYDIIKSLVTECLLSFFPSKMQIPFLPLHIKLLLIKTPVFLYFSYCNSMITDMTGFGRTIKKLL